MCASRHASARGSGSPESTARAFVDSPPPRRVAASAPTLHGEVDDFSLGVHDARVAVVSCGKGEVGGRVNRGAEAQRECARCVLAPVKPAGEEWRAQRNVARARPLTFTHLEGLSHGPQRRLEGGVDSACRRAQRPKPRRTRRSAKFLHSVAKNTPELSEHLRYRLPICRPRICLTRGTTTRVPRTP